VGKRVKRKKNENREIILIADQRMASFKIPCAATRVRNALSGQGAKKNNLKKGGDPNRVRFLKVAAIWRL